MLDIRVSYEIEEEDVKDLLDSASRGSSYWCENRLGYRGEVDKIFESSLEFSNIVDIEDGASISKVYPLTLSKIRAGLEIFIKKYPMCFADFLGGNYDQSTGDTFLQCCIFGETIYG